MITHAKLRGLMPWAHLPLVGGTVVSPAFRSHGDRSWSAWTTASAARTVARTSWARTIPAPCHIAHAAVATEPSSRSSGSTVCPVGAPSAAPSRAPRNRLREVPTTHGETGGDQRVEVGEQREVVADGLAEADAGVDPDLARRPSAAAASARSTRNAPHLGHDVVVAGVGLHGPGVAQHVHRDEPDAGPGRRGHVGQVAETSLTSVAPAAMAASATSAWRVSMLTRTSPASASIDGDHPAAFLGRIDGLGAGPGRLAADVDDVGALGDQRPAVGDGRLVVEVPAAVGERVGGDVEHAHHERAGRAPYLPPWMNRIASWRVASLRRNRPRTAEVTVVDPAFFTPRIDMQRCSASMTTITPLGCRALLDRLGDLAR